MSTNELQTAGDLYRSRKYRDAKSIYSQFLKDHPARSDIYGNIADCAGSAGEASEFSQAIQAFVKAPKIAPRSVSRLMVVAAKLGDRSSYELLVKAGDRLEKDVLYFCRHATAERLFDNLPEARRLKEIALRMNPDENQKVTLAEIDYDVSVYWEIRHKAQQGRAVVSVAHQSDEAYAKRIAMEYDYIKSVFADAPGGQSPFKRIAEVGCGVGRITPLLKDMGRAIDCYDISEAALSYARENNKILKGVKYIQRNLASEMLPASAYDLVFDNVAVQHISDPKEWSFALANYCQAVAPGGYLFLSEALAREENKGVVHVRQASRDDYKEAIDDSMTLIFEGTAPSGEATFVYRRNKDSRRTGKRKGARR